MQGDSSSHFSVQITSSSSNIGKKWAHFPPWWPNVDWLRVSAGRSAPILLSCQNRPAGYSLHKREHSAESHQRGKLAADRRGWWRGVNTLKPLEVMSSLLRLKDGVWICWPLIRHQYLCPHLCFLSPCTILARLLGSWQCPFTSCYFRLGAAVSKPSLSFFVWKSGPFLPLMHSVSL